MSQSENLYHEVSSFHIAVSQNNKNTTESLYFVKYKYQNSNYEGTSKHKTLIRRKQKFIKVIYFWQDKSLELNEVYPNLNNLKHISKDNLDLMHSDAGGFRKKKVYVSSK